MAADPYNLQRFVEAQRSVYDDALAQLRQGRKTSHWMWFVFPQLAGLGHSAMAQRYALSSIEEARAYADHPILGARLRKCLQALQNLPSDHAAIDIFGNVDALKFCSSLTLFEAAGCGSLFSAAILRWFSGMKDRTTLNLLRSGD
jgi:uncharacterized protein (DUF1810 family)